VYKYNKISYRPHELLLGKLEVTGSFPLSFKSKAITLILAKTAAAAFHSISCDEHTLIQLFNCIVVILLT
jgi:hypothetical protein